MIISRMKTEKKIKKERKASEETPELSCIIGKSFVLPMIQTLRECTRCAEESYKNRHRGIECEKR